MLYVICAPPRLINSSLQLVSAICDGPGTLPSLEELNLLIFGELMTTLDIVYDRLKSTINPTFPDVKCIRTPGGKMRLEKGG
jgi:hypothetical protein